MASAAQFLLPLAPLVWVALGAVFVMLLDAVVDGQERERSLLAPLTAAVLCIAAVLAVAGFRHADVPAPVQVQQFLATDRLALFSDALIFGASALIVLLAGGYLREHQREEGELYVLLLLGALGGAVFARAADLMTLFVGLETLSLAVYALVASRKTSARATEGAVRYFLLGAFAAAVWLFGAALLYGATGSTRLVDIGQHIRSGAADLPLAAAAMALLVAGLAFKLAAVPLHTWAADAYQGAITPVTLFMAVVVKSAAMLALLRLLLLAFGMDDARQGQGGWASLLAGLSALSMVVGNLAALGQRNLKRMLAYSSIAHAGYLLLGAVAAAHGQHQAVAAVLYYLAAYAFSSLLAFGGLMLLGSRGKEAVDLDDVRGAGRVHPLLALPLTLGALSLLGFPPTAGFVGKYLVFVAAVQADAALWPLLGLGLLSSLVGAAYYLRVVMVLFSDPQSSDGRCLAQPMVARGMYVALGVAVYALLHLGLLPASLLDWSLRAAQALG